MNATIDVNQIVADFEESKKTPNFPFVTLSYAQSIDGSIATKNRIQLGLSGAASMRMTHELRAVHDAILVGIGTIISDNPKLTVRLVPGASPQPMVIDSTLRFPLDSKLLESKKMPWIATANQIDSVHENTLNEIGCRIMKFELDEHGKVPLTDLMRQLWLSGIKRIMVEGGASIITSFLELSLVDLVIITIAPRFVGGLPAICRELKTTMSIKSAAYTHLNGDLVIWGQLA